MSEEYELWLARERVKHAEAAHKNAIESLDRTKTRAASLLGFTITLASACVAAVASQTGARKVESGIGALGFSIASILCASVLYSTVLNPMALTPSRFDSIFRPEDEQSEKGALNAYAEYADEAADENETTIQRVQKRMRYAWVAACATPAVTLFFAACAWLSARF